MADKIATKTQAEWLELIGGAEFCVTPVCTLDEALQSQLTAQENILQEQECDLGKLRYMGGPVKFSDASAAISRRAPYLGEHTEEVLGALGYDAEAIHALQAEGAI